MFNEVLNLIPVFAIMMIVNTLCGVYSKIGIEKIAFDWRIFFKGIVKSLIIFASLIALAYCCDVVDFLNLENTPIMILKAGIIGYGAKISLALVNIFKSSVGDTGAIN